MDQTLNSLFERALADEPANSPIDLAQVAMAEGTRLRRRRHLVTGGSAAGVLAVFATIVALNVGAPAAQTAPPMSAGLAAPGASRACASAAPDAAVDVAVFLRADITASQRAALDAALRSDPAVRQFAFESQEQAYQNFKKLWRDSPDFVNSVSADQLPESFRITLVNSSSYPAFAAKVRAIGGTQDIVDMFCGAGVGE